LDTVSKAAGLVVERHISAAGVAIVRVTVAEG
jgi:hypothetical protein